MNSNSKFFIGGSSFESYPKKTNKRNWHIWPGEFIGDNVKEKNPTKNESKLDQVWKEISK